MHKPGTMLITGARKGIGRSLAEHYLAQGFAVIGCSRSESDLQHPGYQHFCLDVADEGAVTNLFTQIRRQNKGLTVLLNNAGIASMNHCMTTPGRMVSSLLDTNVKGTFLCCREAAKLFSKTGYGRIVNFTTVAVPLRLEGEAMYAASKAAVESLTYTLARELASYGVTVNAIGPTPILTDLIRGVPQDKLEALLVRQAIHRFGEFEDVRNVLDFFINPASSFITGQVIYLGGV